VQDREETGRHDREHRHRFRGAVDRGAESGSEQIENRRDERSGVTDTDPEDEGDDVDAPHHRRVVSRCAKAFVDLVDPGADPDQQAEHGGSERHEPAERRPERADDVAVDLLIVPHARQAVPRRRDVGALHVVVAARLHYGCHRRAPLTTWPATPAPDG
jgi:hypothetical protein